MICCENIVKILWTYHLSYLFIYFDTTILRQKKESWCYSSTRLLGCTLLILVGSSFGCSLILDIILLSDAIFIQWNDFVSAKKKSAKLNRTISKKEEAIVM